MNRSVGAILAVGVGALSVGLAAMIALAPSRDTCWLTNGADIRQRADEPARRVLWMPPRPVRASSDADEYEPKISADGTLMVLVKRRPGQNADLFSSRWTHEGWTEPAPIDRVNTVNEELGPELSADSKSLYFYSDRPGGIGGFDLWRSHAEPDGWGTPVNLGPAVNSSWNDYGPALSPDGSRLFLSSNRPRTDEPDQHAEAWSATIRERRNRHDYDLYACRVESDEPQHAEAIADLNTPFDEGAPAASPVGDFLYFASDRSGGMGGYDLYRARLRATGVGSPESLGPQINSASNDLDPGLSTDGFRLYFSSDRQIPSSNPSSAIANTSPAEPRYQLWFSGSREVYEEIEHQAFQWSSLPWTWIMILAALGTLIGILVKLLRSELWRRRFLTLSLLAQCVVISLLLHVMFASVLAVWRVGSGIVDIVRQGGGTRVVLESSGVADARDGGITDQIMGSEVRTELPDAGPTSPPAPILTRIDPPMVEAAPGTLNSSTAPMVALDNALTQVEPSLRLVRVVPERDPIDATTPASIAPAATSEEDRAEADQPLATSPSPAATVNSLIVSGPVQVAPSSGPPIAPASALNVPIGPAAAESSLTFTPTAPALATADGNTEVRVPKTEAASGVAEAESTSNAAAGLSPLAGPGTGVMHSESIHVKPERAQPPSGTNGLMLTLGVDAPTTGDSPARPNLVGTASPSLTGQGVAIPRVASAGKPASGQSEAPHQSGTFSIAPLIPGIASSEGSGAQPVHIAMPERSITAAAPSGLALSLEPGASDSAPSSMARVSITPPARSPTLGVRLPEVSAEPVKPVETFAQRAPEVRGEMLERAGGSRETEKAVGLALDWFTRTQHIDGHWNSREQGAEVDADAAMTGMALLCYLGSGHTHLRDGPYKDNVARGLEWLIARQDSNGDLRKSETMYGQTIATVAICEALAMTGDQALTVPARRAVSFVLNTAAGGRRGEDRDTSVLGWLVFTVESARRAGIAVPENVFAAAEKWIDHVEAPGTPGRYAYRKGESPSAAMTAEAMFVRQLVGHKRDERSMQESARFILQTPPKWTQGAPTHYWYYATLALFQHQGEAWTQWNQALSQELLAHQHRDGPLAGSWDPKDEWSRMGGRLYQTAVCTLSLEAYYRYRAE